MTREIFLEKNVPIHPIQWVYGTNGLRIAFEILDFDLSSVSSIKFYSQTQSGVRYEATGSKNGNLVSFKPISGFFAVGKNTLQCELVATPGTVYSFAVAVYCEQNNKFEGAEQDPIALANYIEQINKNTTDINELKNKSDCATKEELSELESRVTYLEENGGVDSSGAEDGQIVVADGNGGSSWVYPSSVFTKEVIDDAIINALNEVLYGDPAANF